MALEDVRASIFVIMALIASSYGLKYRVGIPVPIMTKNVSLYEKIDTGK